MIGTGLFTGLRAWTLQRVSALYLLLFLVVVLLRFAIAPAKSFEDWQQWWRMPAVTIAALIFFAALCLLAWVGGRDVILDYVRPAGLRAFVLALLAIALAAVGIRFALVLLAA